MKVTVLGAGAMGCLFAASLAKNKAIDLLLIDHNPEKVDTIRGQGIIIQEHGVETTIPVNVQLCGKTDSPADFIFLFVKAYQTTQALQMNPGLIGPDTTIVSLQNGMNHDIVLEKFAKRENIILGTSSHNSTLLGYGKIFHAADGMTAVGSLCGDGNMARVQSVCNLFAGSGLEVKISENVKRLIWQKLFVNLTINPLTMLMQVKNGLIAADANLWNCACALLAEALKVAAADGFIFDRDEIQNWVHSVSIRTGAGFTSMFQDRMHHRPTEIDFINGAVVTLGKKYQIDTPLNSMIVNLVHAAEKGNSVL